MNGFNCLIDKSIEHYNLANGRAIVHFFVAIFLSIPLIWWKILNSIMLGLIVYFGTKIVSHNKNDFSLTIYSGIIFFAGINFLDILVVRQSIYWLTGSFNYVYPLFLLFSYWYMLIKFKENNKNFALILILALFASATTEQVGMMVFGLTLLSILLDLIKKNKINKKMYILLAITLVGLLTVILSPSQFLRIKLETEKKALSIQDFGKYMLNTFFASKIILPYSLFIIISSLFAIISINNKRKNLWNYILISMLILSIFVIFTNASWPEDRVFDFEKNISIAYLALTYICLFIFFARLYFREDNSSNIPIVSFILLVGSQFMMIVSPMYGYRNNLCGIFMMILFSASMIQYITPPKNIILKILWYILAIAVAAYSLTNIVNIINGYKESKLIENKNLSIIEDYKVNNKDTITLYRLNNDNYGWSMPYYSNYHLEWFKKFYNIKTEINWK